MKKPIVVLTGPTAVGKTELSIQLAKVIGGEIISADSMQVYKHMDVGSAKITLEEMDGVRHYLVDELEPFDEFHVVKFQEYAKKYLNEIGIDYIEFKHHRGIMEYMPTERFRLLPAAPDFISRRC